MEIIAVSHMYMYDHKECFSVPPPPAPLPRSTREVLTNLVIIIFRGLHALRREQGKGSRRSEELPDHEKYAVRQCSELSDHDGTFNEIMFRTDGS